MSEDPNTGRGPARLAEAIVLGLVCLAPWAFGSVEAWAALILYAGVALVAAMGILAGRRPRPSSAGAALLGLALLALAQSATLPEGWLRRLAPAAMASLERAAPGEAAAVVGEPDRAVPPPAPILSRLPEATVDVAARLAAAWILFEAVVALGGGPAGLRRFGAALAANATLLALFSLIQALTWNGKIYWVRPTPSIDAWLAGGPFVSHNHLAAYLNLGLGFALASLLTAGRTADGRAKATRMAAGYASAVLLAAIVASRSRSGLLATLGAGALVGPVALGLTRRRACAAAGAVGVVLLVGGLLSVIGSRPIVDRIGTLLDAESYRGRWEIWTGAARAWTEAPLWGSGLGSFAVATAPKFAVDHGSTFMRAENEYVDLLVEGGLVGLGLGLMLLGSVATLGVRAARAASGVEGRAPVLGALFGLAALSIQALGDFCLHIPGVAVAAVVLAAHLTALGFAAARPAKEARSGLRLGPRLAWSALTALALLSARHGFREARAEAVLVGSGVPLTGSGPVEAADDEAALKVRRAKLEAALRLRPDWAEGHLRLGMTLLEQYRRVAAEWIAPETPDEGERAVKSDPIWLHAVVHDPAAESRPTGQELIEHEPIRDYLVPATRCFLEARRAAPELALPHARLASLDFLLEAGEPTEVHLRRALERAGSQTYVLALAARVALQSGEAELAGQALRRWLAAAPREWEQVADLADVSMEPREILEWVVSDDPEMILRFAERLFPDPGDAEEAEPFVRAALDGLDRADLADVDRLRIEAGARMRLGEVDAAIERMRQALALAPDRPEWRRLLVRWLIEAGRTEAAHREALLGLNLGPEDPELARAVDATARALARGEGH